MTIKKAILNPKRNAKKKLPTSIKQINTVLAPSTNPLPLLENNKPISKSNADITSEKMYDALKQYFGYDAFRPLQEDIIKDTLMNRDLLVLMPTGAGKSLCYQLPAVISDGISIVISPLISLIYDQIMHLKNMKIPCFYWNSQLGANEKREIMADFALDKPTCKLLYTTPESITGNATLINLLDKAKSNGNLVRVIIDEAHCVSTWGHEFRPSYLNLGLFRTRYPDIPMVTFTATAIPKVQMDIIKQLKLNNPATYKQSFIRPNLSYNVKSRNNSSIREVADLLRGEYAGKSGIIYCLSRKNCEETSMELKKLGIKADFYHAQINPKLKEEVQNNWVNGKIQVIVATIAFALGINKADVRFVIHLSMPKSLEGYYQETGRAGRDGLPSKCILYYSQKDKHILEFMVNKNSNDAPVSELRKIADMYAFCQNDIDCRKQQLSQYLGEHKIYRCTDGCDNCCTFKLNKWMFKDIGPVIDVIKGYFSTKQQQKKAILVEDLLDQIINTSKYTSTGKISTFNVEDMRRILYRLFAIGLLKPKAILGSDDKIYEIAKWSEKKYNNLISNKDNDDWTLHFRAQTYMNGFVEIKLTSPPQGIDPYSSPRKFTNYNKKKRLPTNKTFPKNSTNLDCILDDDEEEAYVGNKVCEL